MTANIVDVHRAANELDSAVEAVEKASRSLRESHDGASLALDEADSYRGSIASAKYEVRGALAGEAGMDLADAQHSIRCFTAELEEREADYLKHLAAREEACRDLIRAAERTLRAIGELKATVDEADALPVGTPVLLTRVRNVWRDTPEYSRLWSPEAGDALPIRKMTRGAVLGPAEGCFARSVLVRFEGAPAPVVVPRFDLYPVLLAVEAVA